MAQLLSKGAHSYLTLNNHDQNGLAFMQIAAIERLKRFGAVGQVVHRHGNNFAQIIGTEDSIEI